MKNITNYIKQNKKETIILGVTILLFILLSLLVSSDKTTQIDTLVHSYILDIRNENLTSSLKIITNFAGASFLLALSAILLIIMKNKRIPAYITLNLVCAFFINEMAKSIFTRSRPIGINLIDETGFSYPSGHSMVAMAFFGFIIYLLHKKDPKKTTKKIFTIGLIITILLIGFSRIYLGVHYISDVIGGFLLAIAYLTIYIKCIKLEKK